MESSSLEVLKKTIDVALRDMVQSGHRHGLAVGLNEIIGLSDPNDSTIL